MAGVLSVLMVCAAGWRPIGGRLRETSPPGQLQARRRHHRASRKQPAKSPQSGAANLPAAPASASRAARAARTARIRQAFVASTELRPMAQQLANLRTPEAYAGVIAYARKHTGEAAAAAYLALGHAYLLDKRYSEAEVSLRQARKDGVGTGRLCGFPGRAGQSRCGRRGRG